MKKILDGSAITIDVALVDENGEALVDIASVEYSLESNAAIIVAQTPVSGYTTGDDSTSVTISGANNTMAALADVNDVNATHVFREARILNVYVTKTDGSVIKFQEFYAVEREELLIAGVNSFQSYSQALVSAFDVPGITGWDSATKEERIAALIEARRKISKLRFNYDLIDMSNISYTTIDTSNIAGAIPALDLIGKTTFDSLPQRFKTALMLAQIVEADFSLNGDEFEEIKNAGIERERIGETDTWFIKGKTSVERPVSKRTLSYLSQFLNNGITIGRA